jgi:hypothetical protein
MRGEPKVSLRNRIDCSHFDRLIIAITIAAVRLELAKQDAADIQSGSSLLLHEDCSPSVLISTALELEEQQYVY